MIWTGNSSDSVPRIIGIYNGGQYWERGTSCNVNDWKNDGGLQC